MQVPFIGGFAEARSLSLNAQKSINCFPEIGTKEDENALSLRGTPGLKYFAQAQPYGSGADGVVTIAADTTLTRDMQYATLTVDANKTLNTAGFTVLVSGTLTNNGIITDSTSGGSGGVGGTGYQSTGGAGGIGTFPGSGVGGDGGSGRGNTGVGGTGGKGGGRVRIAARVLTNNGVIQANALAATSPSGEGGDGADGGNGGTALLTYDTRTVGTVAVTAGAHSDGIAYGINTNNKLCLLVNESPLIDSSTESHTITTYGNAALDSNSTPFTTGNSVKLTSSTFDYLSIDNVASVNFGSDLYTIEGYFDVPIGKTVIIFSYTQSSSTYVYGYFGRIDATTGYIGIQSSINGLDNGSIAFNITSLNTGYNHFAFIRGWGGVSNQCAITVNGVKVSNAALGWPGDWPTYAISDTFFIGRNTSSYSDCNFTNYNIFKGIARWTAEFTPPPTQYSVAVDGADGSAGTATWVNIPYFSVSSAAFRGGLVANNKLYTVVGSSILVTTTAGVTTALGTITTTTGNVFLASNGIQVLIVDGTVYGHYITLATDVLSDIVDGDFPAATSCTFIDGFFVVTTLNTGRIYKSGLYDATSWNPLEYATAEGNPDYLLRCFHGNGNLWLFGTETTEVWYNSGAADFPFAKVSGALIEDGLAGAAAIALIKDQFYFLNNHLEVLRTTGYQREKISTIYLDKEISGYTTTSDAVGYEYRLDGHIFFVLTFPTEDKTWVYDATTDFWHEWKSYKTQSVATYGRHRGAIGFYFNKKYIVGDYSNGFLYELSATTYTDNGEIIPRTRRTQFLSREQKRISHHTVEIYFETGVGIGGSSTGSNPTAYLSWSDDGTKTWSTPIGCSLGEKDTVVRVIWRRLGSTRNRVYELTVNEPVKFEIIAAYAELEGLKA